MSGRPCARAAATAAVIALVRSPQRKVRKNKNKEKTPVFLDCSACDERFYSTASLQKHQQVVHRQQQRPVKEIRTSSHPPTGQYFHPLDPDDMRFFGSIHQKIADNLLHHVDGKLPASSSSPKKQLLVVEPDPLSSGPDLSLYNFAPSLSSPVPLAPHSLDSRGRTSAAKNSNQSSCNFVCSVCGEKFASRLGLSGHAENNHPDVSHSDPVTQSGSKVPPQLLHWRYNSPQGLLAVSEVVSYPPTGPRPGLRCTKCGLFFHSTDLLHQHVLICAQSSQTADHRQDTNSSKLGTRSDKRKKQEVCSAVAANSPPNNKRKKHQSKQQDTLSSHHHQPESNNLMTPKTEIQPLSCRTCGENFSDCECLGSQGSGSRKRLHPGSKSESWTEAEHNSRPFAGSETRSSSVTAVSPSHPRRKNASKEKDDGHRGSICQTGSEDLAVDGGHMCPHCSKRFAYAANFKKHVKQKVCLVGKETEVPAKRSQKSGNEVSEDSSCEASASIPDQETDETEDEDEGVSGSSPAAQEVHLSKDESALVPFKGTAAQHHTCPFCQRGFAYQANYTKHIRQSCLLRQRIRTEESPGLQSCDSSADSENSALNSMSGQRDCRPRGRSFSHLCNVCHKSYSSLVDLMKHRLSHKLFSESNAGSFDENVTNGATTPSSARNRPDGESVVQTSRSNGSVREERSASALSPEKVVCRSADSTSEDKRNGSGSREVRRTLRNKQ